MTRVLGYRPAPHERRPSGRRSWAFDAFVALFAIATEVSAVVDADPSSSVLLIVLAVSAGAAVLLRREAPLLVLGAVLALNLGCAVSGGETGASLLISLYTVAALCERRVSLAALGVALPVVVMLTFATSLEPGDPTSGVIERIATELPVIAGTWALGAYIRSRRREKRELEEREAFMERERDQRARLTVHEEREAIARELHDIVAHSVSVMLLGVRAAREVMSRSPEVADDTLARVEKSGEQSIAELRRILSLLREEDSEAESRPQPSLSDLDALVAEFRESGLPVRLDVTGEPRELPSGVQLSVFRIVQEALTNVLKHAKAGEVTVALAYRDGRLEVEVVDDGVGPDGSTGGHGLVGMRERVTLLGGTLETGPREAGGFRVAASLPYREAQA